MSDSTIDDSRAIEDRVPESTRLDARYELGALLGEGGMGEVRECRDRVLDRKVGLKLVRRDRLSRELEARFVREACVQAQLEHPGVVPVYEVGRAESGAAFFTMRKVDGLALDEVLERKRKNDREIEEKFTRHRLLTAFAQVCLTVDYAHSRGVLHRDVKPSNVMFGDFGEVYVLDWGLAKLTALRERDPDITGPTAPQIRAAQTAIGATLGTPAYMPPENRSDTPRSVRRRVRRGRLVIRQQREPDAVQRRAGRPRREARLPRRLSPSSVTSSEAQANRRRERYSFGAWCRLPVRDIGTRTTSISPTSATAAESTNMSTA